MVYDVTNGYARPASGMTKSVAAIDSFVSSKGQPLGLAPLNSNGTLPYTQLHWRQAPHRVYGQTGSGGDMCTYGLGWPWVGR
jgi:hypothetical protein